MDDSDPIIIGKSDDLSSFISDAFCGIQYKLLAMMFIVFIILSSDVFINRALSKIKGAVDYKYPTSWGTVLQGIILVLSCIFIDASIHHNII